MSKTVARVCYLSMQPKCACPAEHMVCYTSSCVVYACVHFRSYSVAPGCAMFSHILTIVMYMQLLHVLHVHLLRITPQYHAFIYYFETVVVLLWQLTPSPPPAPWLCCY